MSASPHHRTRKNNGTIPGFLPSKPRAPPISTMTVQELRDLHARNADTLSKPTASTSSYVQRLSAQQAAIEARLAELGVEDIRSMMSRADLNDRDVEMKVDEPSSSAAPVMNSKLDTKRRLTAKYYANAIQPSSKGASSFSFAEAVRLEQEAHAADRARKEAMEERKRRMGLPIKGEVLTRAEMDARMWAFLTYKPTDSDLEDEDEYDDSDEDDPATWFDDDQDDGRKGQDIVEPDYEDLASVIRIDESRIPQGVFYEPKDVD